MESIFTRLYEENSWGGSGPGSHPHATAAYRAVLSAVMRSHGVRSVLDVGCGDWQFSQLMDWNGIDYLGIDVVAKLIEANTARFARPGIRFAHLDAANAELAPADLLVMKDVLQHWTNQEILQFLPRIKPFKIALITNDLSSDFASPEAAAVNLDQFSDARCRYRPIDIIKAPFCMNAESVLAWTVGGSVKVSYLLRGGVTAGCV